MFLVTAISLVVGAMWNSLPFIKTTVHGILDPTIGAILSWNPSWGLLLVSAILVLITTLIQKYTTDQEELRLIKKEQKILQDEMNKYKDNPEKMLEFQKKQLEFIPRTMDITMRPLLYTAIPFILFLRWFSDFFLLHPEPIFGLVSWIWAYLIFSIVFSMIFRKVFNVA